MIDKRLFTFGCSYTSYSYPTWADIIGNGFKTYRNFGRAGACNTYIMNRFVEMNNKYQFNEDDMVFVMFTGFSRFSYLHPEDKNWKTSGELELYYNNTKDELIGKFLNSTWTSDLGIYLSWVAITAIKEILQKNNVQHKLLLALNNKHWISNPEIYSLHPDSVHLVKNFYNYLDDKLSLDEWKHKNYTNDDYVEWKNGEVDTHPTIQMHYDYVKYKFSDLLNENTDKFVNSEMEKFDYSSQHIQGAKYYKRVFSQNEPEKMYYGR
jgi:hypothetical protein